MQTITADASYTVLMDTQYNYPTFSSEGPKSLSQTLPADILLLIVKELFSHPTELFAALICSRVCSRWRKLIFGAPTLWSFIDTSRGPRFTQLWLTNSKQSLLDIRLCDRRLGTKYLKHSLLHSDSSWSPDPIPDSIKSQVHRWRSLDISLSCTCRVSRALQFLKDLPNTLYLNSLNIGPMGKANLLLDDISTRNLAFTNPPVVNLALIPPHLRNVAVRPISLRVDSYPVYSNSDIFSPRLTTLEVFLGAFLAHDPDHVEWHRILTSIPNLVELSLWDPRYAARRNSVLPKDQEPIELRSLKTLKLSGRFVHLTELLTKSPLLSLNHLLLDSLDTSITTLPVYLSMIATVSPALTHVSIGSMSNAPGDLNTRGWARAFQCLASLQELTFVETEWREIVVALQEPTMLPHTLRRVRLERIWDLPNVPGANIPLVEFINCVHGPIGRCNNIDHQDECHSRDGSNCELRSLFQP